MKLACQENLIPGNTVSKKWDNIRLCGFDAIELRAEGNFALKKRLPELRKLVKRGVQISSICISMDHFIGDIDKDLRKDARENLKFLLSACAELAGLGVVTPASYGKHSNFLPPFRFLRSDKESTKILLDALDELGEHAAKEGVLVLLEPLNRYEDHMLNTVEQAVTMCKLLKHRGVKVMADIFHMNIEEQSIEKTLEKYHKYIAHIHLADSNRFEPGQGHIQFESIIKTLHTLQFNGFAALECRLKKPGLKALKNTCAFLKKKIII